jgi:hypothetical protein
LFLEEYHFSLRHSRVKVEMNAALVGENLGSAVGPAIAAAMNNGRVRGPNKPANIGANIKVTELNISPASIEPEYAGNTGDNIAIPALTLGGKRRKASRKNRKSSRKNRKSSRKASRKARRATKNRKSSRKARRATKNRK